jgi:PAT family beta-lactamase induction signal transducer AmpG
VLLAFWTTTLEVAADAWRIELAPTPEEQGPVAAPICGAIAARWSRPAAALIVRRCRREPRRCAIEPGWTIRLSADRGGGFLPLPILALLPRQTRA